MNKLILTFLIILVTYNLFAFIPPINNNSILLKKYKKSIKMLEKLIELDDKINLINEYKINTANQYYMLYGKDISYFTLFHCQNPIIIDNYPTLGEEVIDCLKSVGTIKCIDYTENKDAIEIWVDYNDTSVCIYLFPYDNGVINCYNS